MGVWPLRHQQLSLTQPSALAPRTSAELRPGHCREPPDSGAQRGAQPWASPLLLHLCGGATPSLSSDSLGRKHTCGHGVPRASGAPQCSSPGPAPGGRSREWRPADPRGESPSAPGMCSNFTPSSRVIASEIRVRLKDRCRELRDTAFVPLPVNRAIRLGGPPIFSALSAACRRPL